MRHRPIIDAGPGLNFFSAHRERLLIGTVGPLSAPEAVRDEILRKASRDTRFAAAERVWRRLGPRYMEVLSDDITAPLAEAVSRVAGMPVADRMRTGRDLGEIMVIAHAVVMAEQGRDVLVLIDDQDGRRRASVEARRLVRMQSQGRKVDTLRVIGTVAVLASAAGGEHLPDRAALRELYPRLRLLDDGLPDLTDTGLLRLSAWDS